MRGTKHADLSLEYEKKVMVVFYTLIEGCTDLWILTGICYRCPSRPFRFRARLRRENPSMNGSECDLYGSISRVSIEGAYLFQPCTKYYVYVSDRWYFCRTSPLTVSSHPASKILLSNGITICLFEITLLIVLFGKHSPPQINLSVSNRCIRFPHT